MLNPQVIENAIARATAKIAPFLQDADVTEVMINPGGVVFVERNATITRSELRLSEQEIVLAMNAISAMMSREAVSAKSPVVNASIGGLRIAGALTGVSDAGSVLSIRRHQDPERRPDIGKLIAWGAIQAGQAERLRQLIVHQRLNLVIAGGTSSGKTTVANALLSLITGNERLITIEDARELHIGVENAVNLVTSPTAVPPVTARDLVKLCMRMRPDRIILGETRGEETYDLIRAMNSGHDGTITTIHASSAEGALDALEMLFQMSLPASASMPSDVVRQLIARAVHAVVYAHREIVDVDGARKYRRYVRDIVLVKGVKDNGYYDLESI
jgi:Flp pilus assembly CpaF family ATPase